MDVHQQSPDIVSVYTRKQTGMGGYACELKYIPSRPTVLPSILPACAVDAAGALGHSNIRTHTTNPECQQVTYLLVDVLAAVSALDGMLDDGILREALVQRSQAVQRETHAGEVDEPIQEKAAVCPRLIRTRSGRTEQK